MISYNGGMEQGAEFERRAARSRILLGESTSDPWKRLEIKSARGIDIEVEARGLEAEGIEPSSKEGKRMQSRWREGVNLRPSWHGTVRGYSSPKSCRCSECTAAWASYYKIRKRLRLGVNAEDAKMELPEGQKCEICGEPATVLDHDHATGEFRGWLCVPCTWVLREDPDWHLKAYAYLITHPSVVEQATLIAEGFERLEQIVRSRREP